MHSSEPKGFQPEIDSVELLNSEPPATALSAGDINDPDLPTPSHSSATCDQELDRSLSGYEYVLPQEQIAQNPAFPRDSSRLLVVDASHHTHRIFRDLPELLRPGDLLVLNNTRVIPARLYGYKPSGGLIEVLLLEEQQDNIWLALVKPGRRLKLGAKIFFEPQRASFRCGYASRKTRGGCKEHTEELSATVLETDEATGGRLLQFETSQVGVSVVQLLDSFGQMPLPPYITDSQAQMEEYQTIYAQRPGAIAAPTAGLHFTPNLLERLQERGIEHTFVTLHVGVGTFRPVEVEDVTTHKMHEEWVEVPAATVDRISQTKAAGGRIIAVGTTAARALEGASVSGQLQPFCGKTNLFIYPGYQWRVVEGLITNFHLPRSSLLMLVSALIGRQRLMALYQEAIASRYRFYSFGDAMLILPCSTNRYLLPSD